MADKNPIVNKNENYLVPKGKRISLKAAAEILRKKKANTDGN